jgi:hypothetical protein
MPSVNRLFSLLVVSSLAVLAACGSGGSHTNPTPPPTGGFTPASLNGTYVFSTSGVDASGNSLVMVGTFAANGSGGITGGTVDMSDPAFSPATVKVSITGGKYSLTADGRGQASLSANTPFANSIGVDLVLVSSSHGSIAEFDGNGTGGGTLDLQTSATFSGSYAFNLSGIDAGGSPLATIGSFTLGSGGTFSSGIQDFNDVGAFTSFALTGSVSPGSGGAPGTATLTTTGALGSLTFDVFPVGSTDLKFIETGGSALLSGDAFAQQAASLPTTATTFAFVMSGVVITTGAPLALGGLMPIDGVSAISGGTVDLNDNGSAVIGQGFNGSYAAPGTGGRTVITVGGFSVATQFVAYPTASAGLQMLESDGTGLLGGVALAQSSPPASLQSSQGYAMNLSAFNLSAGAEEDDIAEFTTTSSAFSGQIDINDVGQISSGQPYSGNYTLDSPATGRGEFTQSNYNLGVFYAVDSSTLLFLDAGDSIGLVGTGTLQLQNAGAQAALASQHALVMPRPLPHGNRRLQGK